MEEDKILHPLTVFRNRLMKIGIETEFFGNYPWIYLDKINGIRVTEKFEADHGFTVAFLPVRRDQPFHFTDLRVIFHTIRTYVERK